VVVSECWVLSQHWVGKKNYRIRGTAMLVLRRRKGEQIIINEEIRIYVAQASEGSCTLSIEAPSSFVIRRGELPPFDKRVPRGISSAIQATK
jgi:carbon storage regulator CsrA